jgi:hypothetical protein
MEGEVAGPQRTNPRRSLSFVAKSFPFIVGFAFC